MPLSSGAESVAKLAAGWILAAGLSVGAVVYFDEIRTALGMRVTADDIVDRGPSERRVMPEPEARSPARADRTVEIRAGRSGHFETTAYIYGRAIQVLVDTGATMVAMPY